MTIKIGLTGAMGCGKSTIAVILQKEIETQKRFQTLVLPFGKALKEIAQDLGWDGEKDEKGRKVLQYLGTEVCRTLDPGYWVKRWDEQILRTYVNTSDFVVIADDVRFQNEFDSCHYVFKIVGPVNEALERGVPGHESELNEFSTQPISVTILGFGERYLKQGAEWILKSVFPETDSQDLHPENGVSGMVENQKNINRKLEDGHLEMNVNAVRFFTEILFQLTDLKTKFDCSTCLVNQEAGIDFCESFGDSDIFGDSDSFQNICPAVRFMEIYNELVKL